MVVVHDDENRRRRILIVLLVLLISTSSAVALGYAYTNASTATNTENIISGEGLEVHLLGTDKKVLERGEFSTEHRAWYVATDWVDGEITDKNMVPIENVLIGDGYLEIKTDADSISQVKVWYTIEWTKGNGETELTVGDVDPVGAGEENAVTINLEEVRTLVRVELFGEITPDEEEEGYVAEYDIVFYVEPVTQ